MKIRVLGCGTSSGVPRIGNDWGACDPLEPKNRRTRSSIIIESDKQRMLVDCGPDLRQQLLTANISHLDGIIVTHDHADHCHGIDELRQVYYHVGKQRPLYSRGETLQRLHNRFGYAFQGNKYYPAVLEGIAVKEGIPLGQAQLRFVDQPHGGITSLGIRADEGDRSFVYAIDFHEMTDDMASLYRGADVWLCDCLRRTPHPTHANLSAVLGWATDLKVGQLLLTHLDKSMDYASLMAELPDWAAPAFDGQEILV
nr:MBL fold metallo-hydrolase [uncultured Sphingomonas sp.]